MDTSQKTESLKQLMDEIISMRIMLPEFQRDFVWDEQKSYDLFDSLIRDIFIGSLIYGVPTFEITTRELDLRPRKGEGSRKKLIIKSFSKQEVNEKVKTGGMRLLLDGQQRATSIARALSGSDPVWVVFKTPPVTPPVKSDQVRLEDELDNVSGRESDSMLSILLSDVYGFLCGKNQREKEKAELLLNTKYAKSLGLDSIEKIQASPMFDRYITFTTKLQDMMKSEKLVAYYMLDTNAEKFSLFFERSNSKGIQLDFIDILAAKLYSGFNLRLKCNNFKDENPSIVLRREVIVRAIAVMVSDAKDMNRTYILSSLTADHFNQYWDTLCSHFKKALEYLNANRYVLTQEWMPYDSMVIPLMMLLESLPRADLSQLDETQSLFIKYWFWASIFSTRYSGSTNEVTIADSKAMRALAAKDYQTVKSYLEGTRFTKQVEKADEFSYIYKRGSALYKGTLNLINFVNGGLRDWMNGDKLLFSSNPEEHHIFPKKYLKKLDSGLDDSLIDCVANKTLIPKITNIKIGAQAPSIYLKHLLGKNGELMQALRSHAVPTDLINGSLDMSFEQFVADRSAEMLQMISDTLEPTREALETRIAGFL
jgi:hypothetical protein